MSRALELREEAGKSWNEAQHILAAAETEKRVMTAEENTRFDALSDESEAKIAEAERIERSERTAAAGKTPRKVEVGGKPAGPVDHKATPEYADAFVGFMARGFTPAIANALQIDSDPGGGFISASERFIAGVLAAVDDATPFRSLATGYTAAPGESLGVITLDSDVSEFTWGAGELEDAVEDTGPTWGKRELMPRDLKRKIVKISKKLIQSSRINVEQFVQERVAYALSKTLERAYMTGDGANKPLGIFTASTDGIPTTRDVATLSATGFTADGLINIQGTLKPQYDGAARWMFHRDAITAIRKLKDGNGVYLWQPGLTSGIPNQILGKPYLLSEFVPNTYTNGLYAGMYGDFSRYWYVDRAAMGVQRLLEMYASTGQIGLLFDGMGADGMPSIAEAFVRVKCAAS